MICVYEIRHPSSGVFYIGSTSNSVRRKWEHMSKLRRGVHDNEMLQYAYNFDRELVWEFIEMTTREEAHALEQEKIKAHFGSPLLMNQVGAKEVSEATRKKFSLIHAGRIHSDETKQKLSDQRKGVPKNPEWISKITDSRRIKISVDGIVYRSASEAAIAHNVNVQTVLNRVKNSKFPDWFKVKLETD